MDGKEVNLQIDEITEKIKVYSIDDEEYLPRTLREESPEVDKNVEEYSNLKCNGTCNARRLTKKDKNKASSAVPSEIIVSVQQENNVQLEDVEVSPISITIMPGYVTTVTVCRQHKEYFCQFTKVLVRYLQLVYPSLYVRAKDIIQECDKLKKEGRPGYEILAFSIQFNLRRLVGKQVWSKAAEYHTKWLMNHYKTHGTYTSENEAKVTARRIVCIASQPLVHPSKLRGYRGRTKIESMRQTHNRVPS